IDIAVLGFLDITNNSKISLIISSLTITNPLLLNADIITDGSVGASQSLNGPDYAIPETLGTVKGNNLFHSFEKFSIKTEESATFTGSNSIKNVISRVTGGEKSDIDGTLSSKVGKADFYFVNPSGVVFGPNAKIDVPASFHVSTTDELKFADGSSFKASKPETSTLTQAAPEAFGFLGTQSASIEVNGESIKIDGSDIEINGSTLEFKPESKVSLTSSKDITITGTEDNITGLVNPASLVSDGGEISLTAKKDLDMNAAKVDTSGNGTGKIVVKADNVKITNNSTISSDNTGTMTTDTGGIEVVAGSNLELAQGSRIQSNVFGSGDSGTVKVESGSILIKQQEGEGLTGILIEVEPEATGNGKTVDVHVKESLKIEGVAGIASSTSGFGDAASVNVTAGQLKMDGQGRDLSYRNSNYVAGIASNALANSYGNTSDVSVYVDNLLEMTGGCGISSYSSGMGEGSNVSIKAGEMKVDGSTANNYLTIIATSSGSEGKSVKTNIQVDGKLELLGGAQIYSETSFQGDAGEVEITVNELKIDNKGLAEKYTGVWSDTYFGAGNAGKINIAVTGLMELLNGANISSSTTSEGNAGEISINAGEFIIDHQGIHNQSTGIWSNAYSGSKGNSGKVDIAVSGMMELLNGAKISSSTWSEGDTGKISINARNFKIDNQGIENQYTGIWSDTYYGSKGNAGTVEIKVDGLIELLNGANISSSTSSDGDAGEVFITSSDFRIDHQGINNQDTGIWSTSRYGATGKAGKVDIKVSGLIELLNGAKISSSTGSSEDAGEISIIAKDCKIDNQSLENQKTGIWSDTYSNFKGNAGKVELTVSGMLELLNGAQISSETFSQGDAGKIDIAVLGFLDITNNSKISSETHSEGKGGNVLIDAGSIRIDNHGLLGFTGIWSDANSGSQGDAGRVNIRVADKLELLNGAQISSETRSKGNAGSVEITASGLLKILNSSYISSSTYADGDAGSVKIVADGIKLDGEHTGIWSLSYYDESADKAVNNAQGKAGQIDIVVDGLAEILNGAQIYSLTFFKQYGGDIKLTANQLKIDGQGNNAQQTGIVSDTYSDFQGKAGNIEINVDGLVEILDGSKVSSMTTSQGDAGVITIISGNLTIDDRNNDLLTGVYSDTISIEGIYGSGDGGNIDIQVKDQFSILNGATISSNTSSQGNAGDISIDTNILIADSGYIESATSENAMGYVGNIKINANSIKMMNESAISITGLQTLSDDKLIYLPEQSIAITAKEFLINGSYISSMSTQNVPAASINLQTDKLIVSNNAVISSGANMADGGDIGIQGENIFLYDSLITTSVEGENGDGGNVTINRSSPYQTVSDGFLIMQGGFIQANTAGKDRSGGEIDINVKGVIADKTQELNIGGNERYQFEPYKNVIQSAAPDGDPGEINISGLQLDISSSIMNMPADFLDDFRLATDLCRNLGVQKSSTLVQMGRGGFEEIPSDPSSISFGGRRLDDILSHLERQL
ncbi:MAG: filamentous hemagglutinin N-terminal domain-containing protein, partial [Desulfamplus sp.]|nr:filamentous hemagglutinin N-terminal domain-containing protein [Desulfamplus sp.]